MNLNYALSPWAPTIRRAVTVFKFFCKGVLSGKVRDSKIFRARGKKASKTA